MQIELIMPKMGESLQEGTIIKWLKKEGDRVERDEMILEISTDKVDTEVPAPAAGIITKILAKENETVEVGKVIAIIETEGEILSDEAPVQKKVQTDSYIDEKIIPKVATSSTTSANLVDVVMPKMGESLQEGTIIKWLKRVGDKIERDEMLLEISTDKVDTEVPSPVTGEVAEILFKENETVAVGQVIARIATGELSTVKPLPEVYESVETQEVSKISAKSDAPVTTETLVTEIPREKDGKFFSPLVREIAKDKGISLQELETIDGTGIDGRVTKDDLLKYLETRSTIRTKQPDKSKEEIIIKPITEPVPPPPRAISVGPDREIIPMDRVRQLIAEHMVYSKRTSAHVTSVGEADVTGLVKLRENLKGRFIAEEGFKLTFTPFFAKAVIDGVKKYPMVNVSVEDKNIIRYRRINLGIATALEDGNLIVPVIKSADDLGIRGLARQIYDLSTRARTKKLNPDDIQGGTITLTNVGTFGTLFGTPIINQPQTAIIGVGAINKRPVVKEIDGEDHIVIRSMMYVSITYDHRVIDGMLAGQCLAAIIQSLESFNQDTKL